MTAALLGEGLSPDVELVAESRGGNREAFGRIVGRYQGMVAGVIYSVCGDLHRSEDLAQETFLSAWKSLSGMNDAEKLAPWLCQIARRKAVDFQRSDAREKNRLSHLFPVLTAGESTSPPQEALKREESEMLWRILCELPQRYRETMVLYYRQGQSTAAVALATGMTEDAVRQRLARGREMLRDQMAEILERNLIGSAPSPAFTVAVMAALPSLTGPAAKATTLGAAAKGSSVLGGGGAMAWASALLGPLVAGWMGIFALRRALRFSRSRRERRFLYIFAGLSGLCVAAFWATSAVAPRLFKGHDFYGLGTMGLPIGFTIVALIIIRLGRRRLNAIRISEPSDRTSPIALFSGNPGKMPLGMAVAVVLLGIGRWTVFAWKAGDFQSVTILSILAIGLAIVAGYCWGGNSIARSRRFMLLYMPIFAIITLGIMKWRLNEWLGVIHHWPQPRPAPWSNLLLPATIFACCAVVMLELLGIGKRAVGSVRRLNLPGFNFLYVRTQTTLKTIAETSKTEIPKLFAAMNNANIQPHGSPVYIFQGRAADPSTVFELKIGIAVGDNAAAPDGYEIDPLGPVECQTILYSGRFTKIGLAFQKLMPELYGRNPDSAATVEIREYFLRFEGANSPNNVTLIAGVLK